MRLERLEIAGFKIFPDRSELAFDQGVTAIVGPNGCGKSNVADAITWVMGEQSAKSLRGEKMEDVIFSGSDARKPTGAAEVRLRLSGVASRPRARGEACRANAAAGIEHGGNGHGERPSAGNGGGHAAVEDEPPLIVARGRSDAPAVSLGRERVPDRRRDRAGCATSTIC